MEQNGAPAGNEELSSALAAGATVRQAAETPPVVMIDNNGWYGNVGREAANIES